MDKIQLSLVEVAAFNDLQRHFNRMVVEIINHRGEDANAQWQLMLHDAKTGFLVKVQNNSDKEQE